MKKALILGSDFCTFQVVKVAKSLGLYTIVTDLMETSPTKELADEAWEISTTDIDTLEKMCINNNVNAILFGASDFNISNARELCKRLNLPIYCDNDFSWSIARNKRKFKEICREVGAPVATDFQVSDLLTEDELSSVQYPVVVKPCDKSGNRGMSYCHNREELIEGYKYARTITDNNIIVERKLQGNEYNVHYVLANGTAKLLYFSSTHHEPGQPENLYSFKCTTSEFLKQYLEEVNESAIKVINKAGCKEGIVWFDCMRDSDGHFYLLEMGYRFGGVMTYVPYEQVIGFNSIKWMVECALGIKHYEKDMPPALNSFLLGCAASYHLFSLYDDQISKIEGLDEISAIPGVTIDFPKRSGATLKYRSCSGLIGIYGENIYSLCEKLKKINSKLRILNKNNENMFVIFDDYISLTTEYENGLKEFENKK